MRGAHFALAILLAPALASAGGDTIHEDIHLRGWTANGAAVVEIRDGFDVMSQGVSWVGDDTDQNDYWAVCVPQPIGTEQPAGEGACTVCKDAASCGLAKVMKRASPAKISPDHQIRVKDKKVCTGKGAAKTCKRVVTLGKLDTITHDPGEQAHKLGASRVYFRPDSGAVMVVFEDDLPGFQEGMPDVPRYVPYYVELTAAAGHGAGDGREQGSGSGAGGGGTAGTNPPRDGYRFALENVKKKANGTAGEGDLVLQVTSGGNTTETQIDHLDLTENGVYNMGDPITIDRASKKVAIAGSDAPADLAKAITSHLPADAVVASGFVTESERGYSKLVVGIVVQDTHGVSVVEQTWMDSGGEPEDSRTVKIP